MVALSVAQRDTIRNKLELMRAEYPELEAFCKEGKDEAFFVKNLENVQGDERDVIFISICYGKDAGGYMSQNFGPVSSNGGERRPQRAVHASQEAVSRIRLDSPLRHPRRRDQACWHESAEAVPEVRGDRRAGYPSAHRCRNGQSVRGSRSEGPAEPRLPSSLASRIVGIQD